MYVCMNNGIVCMYIKRESKICLSYDVYCELFKFYQPSYPANICTTLKSIV